MRFLVVVATGVLLFAATAGAADSEDLKNRATIQALDSAVASLESVT